MHERKALMAELSDGFIALPGGFGTLEEFCEAVTWTQLGLHAKPCGLLNVNGFYDGLLQFFEHALILKYAGPLDLLQLAGGVLLVSLALYFTQGKGKA